MVPLTHDDWMPLLKWEPDDEEILLVWDPQDGELKPASPTCVQDPSVVFVEPQGAYVNDGHQQSWLETSYDFSGFNGFYGGGNNNDGYFATDFALGNGEELYAQFHAPEALDADESVLKDLPFDVEELLPATPQEERDPGEIYAEISRECHAIEERQTSASPASVVSSNDSDYVEDSPPPLKRRYRKATADIVPTRTGGKVSVRKKEQNRAAAMRYREKKRTERQTLYGEADQLEKDNNSLKTKVRSLESEIQYLKTLMREVGMRVPV
ncbi:hypothetical protein L596_019323 [Steinernema carpocapsae]|uniref:BZIP domain-containing protein n=1 Tax=Steinernema carpocapsae TaxID=34508 RepID=A0A4U5MQ84_STECR|nr:hypothetical protein L596_019323 [Steinernema carpocapsae]